MSRLIVGTTKASIAIVAEPGGTLILDLCGRPIGLYLGGYYYARGLGGRWVEKKWLGRLRHIRALPPTEGAEKQKTAARLLKETLERLNDTGGVQKLEVYNEGRLEAPSPALRRRLMGFFRFNEGGLERDVARYHETYGPIGILPPDQYLAVVVQFVEGCFWNRCSFCASFRGRRFRVKMRGEMVRHLRRVKGYFGPSLPARVSVFLGEADVFQAPPPLLEWVCRAARKAFPTQARPSADGAGGIYAFGEVTGILRYAPDDLKRLKSNGLRRVFVGLETACDSLRRAVNKPGTPEEALKAIVSLKSAGLGVGVIVLLGLGGKKREKEHVFDTVRLLKSVLWGPEDIIYFSPLRLLAPATGDPLSEEGMHQQLKLFRSALGRGAPQTSLYDIREFNY